MKKASPGSLVFGRDMISNTLFIADWGDIKIRKQIIIYKNNRLENKIVNCVHIEYDRNY